MAEPVAKMKREVRRIQARIWSPLRQMLRVGVAFSWISSFIRHVLAPLFCLRLNMFQAFVWTVVTMEHWRLIWWLCFTSSGDDSWMRSLWPVIRYCWSLFCTLSFLHKLPIIPDIWTSIRTQSFIRSSHLSVATDSYFCSQQPSAITTCEAFPLRRLVMSRWVSALLRILRILYWLSSSTLFL